MIRGQGLDNKNKVSTVTFGGVAGNLQRESSFRALKDHNTALTGLAALNEALKSPIEADEGL